MLIWVNSEWSLVLFAWSGVLKYLSLIYTQRQTWTRWKCHRLVKMVHCSMSETSVVSVLVSSTVALHKFKFKTSCFSSSLFKPHSQMTIQIKIQIYFKIGFQNKVDRRNKRLHTNCKNPSDDITAWIHKLSRQVQRQRIKMWTLSSDSFLSVVFGTEE